MKYTKEQMKILEAQEERMRTAVNAGWASYPGLQATKALAEIYDEVSGRRNNINLSCGTCILHLLQDLGRPYFEQKEAEKVVKVTIKEKKPKTTKK